jgi:cyclopropane fatty-acyl-phospholipid synthase-like methyltransferase
VSETAFEQELAARSAEVYADFLLPHLDRHSHLLDVGCGDGALAVGRGSECEEGPR